jgi:AraC-like DNA-binding protein
MVEIFDDIRKIYQFSAPCEELSDYIEFFSESSAEKTTCHTGGEHFTIKMFPSWTPTFWINLGAPYQLRMGSRCYQIRPQDDIVVLRDTITARHNLPSDHLFTVKFFPGGLEAIFGINQAKFIDKMVALNTILPPSLIQCVKASGSFGQRMNLLQNYCLLHFNRQKRRDHYLQFVKDSMDLYSDGNMQYNTGELAKKMFVTSRTITRYFNSVVGIPPKKYFSIVRARAALTAYVQQPGSFDPCDHGYHDRSHFHKAIIRFTGRRIAGQS